MYALFYNHLHISVPGLSLRFVSKFLIKPYEIKKNCLTSSKKSNRPSILLKKSKKYQFATVRSHTLPAFQD